MAYVLCAVALAVFLIVPVGGKIRRSFRRANATVQQQPAAEPEPFWLKDIVGDEVGVNSLPGQARISLSVDDIMWLDPDEADQLADALKAHAAARRAETPGGGESRG